MSKAKPYLMFALWCWCAGWARSASDVEWCAEHGIGAWRARIIVGAAQVGMAICSPFWWWVK